MSAIRPGGPLQQRKTQPFVNIVPTVGGWLLSICVDGYETRVIGLPSLLDALAYAERIVKSSL